MKSASTQVLVVEDDAGIRDQLRWCLDDYSVSTASTAIEAVVALRRHEPAVVLLDLGLPPDPGGATEGLRVLEELLGLAPHTKVIVITGNDDHAHAVAAVGMGAYDYYRKPIDADALLHVVERADRLHRLESENRRLQQYQGTSPLNGIIATSDAMLGVCREIEKLAPLDIATMLLGESGTGKELLARALHELGPRRDGRLVAINCAAIPENLLESELFGYERGAFTGAAKQTRGKFEFAHGGTLFLDEIGDLPLELQAKLLRFLQERTIERVGGREPIAIDTRVVSATHKNIEELVERQLFREDLYYRLGEVSVQIPPLREREGDLPLIARALMQRFARDLSRPVKTLSSSAISAIEKHPWPGNVREMENRIKRAVVMAEGDAIQAADLNLVAAEDDESEQSLNLREVREHAERTAVVRALARTDHNISRAAKLLGVTRPTLYDAMNRYGISQKCRSETNSDDPPPVEQNGVPRV